MAIADSTKWQAEQRPEQRAAQREDEITLLRRSWTAPRWSCRQWGLLKRKHGETEGICCMIDAVDLLDGKLDGKPSRLPENCGLHAPGVCGDEHVLFCGTEVAQVKCLIIDRRLLTRATPAGRTHSKEQAQCNRSHCPVPAFNHRTSLQPSFVPPSNAHAFAFIGLTRGRRSIRVIAREDERCHPLFSFAIMPPIT
jgi:hypothetical protein